MRTTLALSALAAAAALALSACSSGSDSPPPSPATIGTARWSADTIVPSDLTVTGTLTVDAGVDVSLAPGAKLKIAAGGILIAEGTEAEKIIFRARDAGSPWGGLVFEAGSAGSRLDRCDLSGAGGGYAVVFGQGASAQIRRGWIHGNAAGGIDASAAGAGTLIHQNYIYENALYGLRVDGFVDSGSVALSESNWFHSESGGIDLDDPYCKIPFSGADVTMDAVLDSFAVPYLFDKDVNVRSGGSLTVMDETVVEVGPRALITVKAGGAFNVAGSSFMSAQIKAASPGQRWRCLFLDAGSLDSRLEYCSIGGAGSNGEPAISFGDGAGAIVSYCGFDGNAAGGIDAMQANGARTTVTNCAFIDNGDIDGNGIYDMIMGGGTYLSNAGNHIVSSDDL